MRNKRLQSQVTAGRWTLPAVIFICALCWVLTYFLFPDSIASTTPKDSSSFLQSTRDLLLPGWAERIVSFLVYAIIGYFLIELNNQFSIIRMRASILFLLLYRSGKYSFPAAHHPLGTLVARSLPFPVAHSSQFLRRAARMDAALLDAVRTRLLL